MVLEEEFNGVDSFKCEECGFHFEEKDLAEKCESYCRDKGVCSSEITKNALERN